MNRPVSQPSRIPELDVLRFIAAAGVMIYHFTFRPVIGGVADDYAYAALQSVTRFGYLGVNLFFMISGFVILWSSQARSPTEFVISRVSRLYPSFWVCLAITTIVLLAAGNRDGLTPHQVIANATMVPGLLGASYVDGVYWTLFVELKFYLLVFAVLLSGTMRHVERWLYLWLGASLLVATGLLPHWIGSLVMYPAGPCFISGGLLFLIRARGLSVVRALCLGLSCLLATQNAVAERAGYMHSTTQASMLIVGAALVAFHLVFLGVVLRPNMLSASPRWAFIGSLTYPLYLLHNRIGKEISHIAADRLSFPLLVVVMVAVALGLATIVALTVERHGCRRVQQELTRWARGIGMIRPAQTLVLKDE